MKKFTKKIKKIVVILLFIIIAINTQFNNGEENSKISYEISNIPEYNGKIYVEINNNTPNFSDEDMNIEQDYYSTLKDGKVRNGDDKDQLEKSK